jgi:post-segregation antitoxin (ccd killing protein)
MNAPKRSSLAIDADLLARAEAAGLDAGALAARAIRRALDERERGRIREEIRRELEWYNAFVAEHGSFADIMREEFGGEHDEPASV